MIEAYVEYGADLCDHKVIILHERDGIKQVETLDLVGMTKVEAIAALAAAVTRLGK